MTTRATIAVWDALVRLFHWGLVAAFGLAWWSQTEDYPTHLVAGYLVLGLVLVRLVWGVMGPRHARFTDFVCGPRATLGYLVAALRGRAPRYLGHNPAGGAMIVALLLTLLLITVSGLALDAAENRAGPLAGLQLFLYADRIGRVHVVATNLCLVLIALHLLGVLQASLAHRENLVLAMLTGRKRGPDGPAAD